MVKISNRLMAAAALVTQGNRLADVGTDHGYIPIYLLLNKQISGAIAMDINAGPLERAKEHIALYELGDYIETRLSDGVAALKPMEADTILVAGMGGGLVMHILEDGKEVCRMAKELILQPQSELERVREYLYEEGYEILVEDIIYEDDKYYPMMKVHYIGKEKMPPVLSVEKQKLSYLYGGLLLQNRHPVLKSFLEKEQSLYQDILEKLQKQPQSEKIQNRMKEVETILADNKRALAYFEVLQSN